MIRLFRIFVPLRVLLLVVSETLLIFGAFVLTSYYALAVDPTVYLIYDQGLTRILLVAASILVAIHFQDLYSQIHVKSRVVLLQQLSLAMGVAFLLQGVIGYLAPGMKLPLGVMAPGAAIALPALFAWRAFFSAYEPKVVSRDRVLLVGGGSLLERIGGHIEAHPELGLQTAGYVRNAGRGDLPEGKALGPVTALREIVETADPRRLVVDMADPRENAPLSDLLELRFAGYGIEDGASAYEKVRGRVYLGAVRLTDLLRSGGLQPRQSAMGYQRACGVALAAVAFAAALPVMALSALAVRLASPGPVLDRRRRMGRNGAPFTMYRLRSKGAGIAGRLVRRLRIDAMPELFNVLRGDMSLVGPRPDRPEFVTAVSQWIPFYRQRQTVRPGMTGWAQVAPDAASYDTAAMLEYDLYYLKNMSLALDTFILFHTLKGALGSRAEEECEF
jgi:lipopolysaccharide/colanic/teichoic acid biosynthesis glycosyltransferase